MARLVRAWPCLVSAILVNLAYPPLPFFLFVLIAIAPWLASLKDCDGKQGFKSGWTFGFLTMLGQLAWLFSFVNKWTSSFPLAFFPFLAGCAFVGLFFGIVGWQVTLCWRHKMPWAIPLVWAGVEVVRSYIPVFAFPYSLIATPLATYPALIQTAYYGSVYMTGAWVVLANVILAMFLTKETGWKRYRGYVGVLLLGVVISLAKFGVETGTEKVVVTVGQPGVDLAYGDPAENNAKLAEIIPGFFARAKLQGSDLLVLPEGIAGPGGSFPPRPVFEISEGVPVLFGGQRGEEKRYQTAFAYDGKWQYADKTRLVIFGEFVPLREQLPFLAKTFQLPGGDLTPANELKSLKIGKIQVGPLLCFEGLFPDLGYRQAQNGSQLLAVMSVDDWYFGTLAPDQLRTSAIWRAVETGRPLVRAASLGYSFAVDSSGRLLGELPLHESRAMRVELMVGNTPPFAAFWVFPAAGVASLILVPLCHLTLRRRPAGNSPKSKKT